MKDLYFEPVLEHSELVPLQIIELLQNLPKEISAEILVSPIDPDFAGSAEFCEKYEVEPSAGANCVIVEAIRGENRTIAACLVPVSCKADLNKTVRKILGARRVSFAPLEEVLKKTGMEYGGVTPIGLPNDWPILIDSRLTELERLIVGGGYRKSKISIPGKLFNELPSVQIVEGLGILNSQ